MRTFAGDERVHAFGGCLLQVTAGTARHHADALANRRTPGNKPRCCAGGAAQSAGQIGARDPSPSLETDELSMIEEKWPQLSQSHRGTKPGVVAQPRVRIQRQMRAINREI